MTTDKPITEYTVDFEVAFFGMMMMMGLLMFILGYFTGSAS